MTEIEPHIRAEIIRLARSRQKVTSGTAECPCKWHPTTIKDPRYDGYFTPEGAWDYIAEMLEAGCPVAVIELDKPPGKKGYVMKFEIAPKKVLYVKVQLGPGGIIGRSFHTSAYS